MKRDKRNIGKAVKINNPRNSFHGRTGIVTGFRGDYEKDIPWVNVYLSSTKSIWPFRADQLEVTK